MDEENKTTSIFKRNHLLKLVILFNLLVIVTFYNNPRVKENIFYFIETNVFYREIPPVYNNTNFKMTEPNKICSIMTKNRLISSSYSRSQYFEFSCETGILISEETDWSIQYVATGKIFNVNTVILKMKIMKDNKKYDSAKIFFNYTHKLLSGLGIYSLPPIVKQNIVSLTDFSMKLDNNINMRYYVIEDEVTLIIN